LRIAVVSDIHGNLTAFEAVLADLRLTSPDVILHGGDLADSGSSPGEIVDRIRELGWQGVVGNADEMLFHPDSLHEFAKQSPQLQPLFAVIDEMASATREALGDKRLTWLSALPRTQTFSEMTLVHASPRTCWRAPSSEASDDELEAVYGSLNKPITIYGHIHRPYIRSLPAMLVANTGSVSLSYDGDYRAAYLLLDNSKAEIRRVDYDVSRELKALAHSRLPHADWVGKVLESGSFQIPPVGRRQ
jgi:putative phosphoesterase